MDEWTQIWFGYSTNLAPTPPMAELATGGEVEERVQVSAAAGTPPVLPQDLQWRDWPRATKVQHR